MVGYCLTGQFGADSEPMHNLSSGSRDQESCLLPVRSINGRDLPASLGNYKKWGDNLDIRVSAATQATH